jgi:hypothetical protein
LNLAFRNQVFNRAGNLFDRHVRVDPMLIEEIDAVGFEALERGLRNLLNVLRAAIEPRKGVNVESEFGGNHHLLAEGSNQPLVNLLGELARAHPRGLRRVAKAVGRRDYRPFLPTSCRSQSAERTVNFGDVEECDPAVDSRPNQ